jgi:hypothetical protein
MLFNPNETEEILKLRIGDLQRQAEEVRLTHIGKVPGGRSDRNWTVRSLINWLMGNLLGRKGHSISRQQGAQCLSHCRSCSANVVNHSG